MTLGYRALFAAKNNSKLSIFALLHDDAVLVYKVRKMQGSKVYTQIEIANANRTLT